MKYLLDTANLEDIRTGFEYFPISGVTTNPTIITQNGGNFIELLKEIRNIIGERKMLHVQTLSEKCDDIIREAYYLREQISGNLYIKIPVTPDGLKAMKKLAKQDMNTTATAVFTANQALMAACSGAAFVAPYVNRIDNVSANGVNIVKQILTELRVYGMHTQVLAASFKNGQQLTEVANIGVDAITVQYDLLKQSIEHPLTDMSVAQFIKDWETTYGQKGIIPEN